MKTFLLAGAAALALGSAAIAQDMAPSEPKSDMAAPPADAAAPPADAATPAPTDPNMAAGKPAPAADPAMAPPAATAAAPADPAKAQQAAATVEAGWATYDKGGKGSLTPLEFGNWIMAARGQDMTAEVEKSKTSKKAALPAIKVLNATAGDFAKADSDKNRMISKEELTAFLSA